MGKKQPAFATFATLDAISRYKRLLALRDSMAGAEWVSNQLWFRVMDDLRQAWLALPASFKANVRQP